MNKTYTRLWLIVAMLGVMCPAFSQEKYSIQLGVFTEQIGGAYFKFSDFNNVQHKVNTFQFHEYKWGTFSTPEAAEQQLLTLQKNVSIHGLNNLKIVPSIPEISVSLTSDTKENYSKSTDFQIFTRSISFSNSKLALKKTDVEVLEEVANILATNPDFKLRIFATKGGKKRKTGKRNICPTTSDIIRNFLLAQNIPAYRIKKMEIKDAFAENSKSTSKVQQVFMALVDLKEEIVFDRFGNDGFIAKEKMVEKTLSALD